MSKFTMAALCAATALCAQQAHAAQYLALDVVANGRGGGSQGDRGGVTPTYEFPISQFGISMYFYLPGTTTAAGIDYNGGLAIPRLEGSSTSSGFAFSGSSPSSEKVRYTFSGKACFANADPFSTPSGFPALDASCSPLTISYINAASLTTYDFTGVLSSATFRIVEASSLPLSTFVPLSTAVPEPSTWALMLAGFGLTGYALRRRRARVAFA